MVRISGPTASQAHSKTYLNSKTTRRLASPGLSSRHCRPRKPYVRPTAHRSTSPPTTSTCEATRRPCLRQRASLRRSALWGRQSSVIPSCNASPDSAAPLVESGIILDRELALQPLHLAMIFLPYGILVGMAICDECTESSNGRVRNRATGAAFRGQAPLERQRPFPERQQPAGPGIRSCVALAARPCPHHSVPPHDREGLPP